MSPKFLSLQCISAAVDNEEDIYSETSDNVFYSSVNNYTIPLGDSNNYKVNGSTITPVYSKYTSISPLYSNYPSLPPSTNHSYSPSCSSGISSGSDPEYDSCELGTGLRYNVRSEGVFTYKEMAGSDRPTDILSREGEYKGEARVTTNNCHKKPGPLHNTHDDPESSACPHQEAGCEWRGRGMNLRNHLDKNVRLHLQMMVAHTKRQAEYIADLQTKIEEASVSKDGTLIWRISNFSQKLLESKNKEGLELVSRPFLTSSNGYKLQASVFLNGNGGGENTHMSIYIKVLPGEHDCILKWPFRHTISFTLLDQNMDRRAAVNVLECFVPDPLWTNFSRPSICNDQDQLGFGFPKFVHQDILTKRGYVKDDTLFIRVRADQKKGVSV